MEAMGTDAVDMAPYEPKKREKPSRDGIAPFRPPNVPAVRQLR